MSDYLNVSTATETRDQAVDLARTAVAERLAAGAQIIGPVTSAFWHDGAFGTGEEWQLLLKTTRARYPELEAHILKHHPWQNPEIAAVAIETGSKGCLDWIAANTTLAD
ncbi:divalent-cation tolerance protein CutA [Streptomyces sp. HUAS TT20]|uniref:divalent-cation tolerance protein CutA n=1 Tax=Streptomyces sp. HUAS TT20 TaxID=3447509 RepID=UPI0021D7DFD6|nr:divalent-cation tolerance protein CutA [Streptomyces sp. HUAS 15-9]UXY28566.1 divalent-cation tolerance protein CutA [Streptomyces sp. HUAS 15-9]